MAEGDSGQDVYRLQRRLSALGYLDQGRRRRVRGQHPGGGQGLSGARPSSRPTETPTSRTVELLFSPEAPKALKPYKLVVDLSEQKLYVYRWQQNAYSKLSYTMSCSTGPEVSAGSYQTLTRPDQQWRQVDAWDGLPTISGWEGDLYIHSVPYGRQGRPGEHRAALGSGLAKSRRRHHGQPGKRPADIRKMSGPNAGRNPRLAGTASSQRGSTALSRFFFTSPGTRQPSGGWDAVSEGELRPHQGDSSLGIAICAGIWVELRPSVPGATGRRGEEELGRWALLMERYIAKASFQTAMEIAVSEMRPWKAGKAMARGEAE